MTESDAFTLQRTVALTPSPPPPYLARTARPSRAAAAAARQECYANRDADCGPGWDLFNQQKAELERLTSGRSGYPNGHGGGGGGATASDAAYLRALSSLGAEARARLADCPDIDVDLSSMRIALRRMLSFQPGLPHFVSEHDEGVLVQLARALSLVNALLFERGVPPLTALIEGFSSSNAPCLLPCCARYQGQPEGAPNCALARARAFACKQRLVPLLVSLDSTGQLAHVNAAAATVLTAGYRFSRSNALPGFDDGANYRQNRRVEIRVLAPDEGRAARAAQEPEVEEALGGALWQHGAQDGEEAEMMRRWQQEQAAQQQAQQQQHGMADALLELQQHLAPESAPSGRRRSSTRSGRRASSKLTPLGPPSSPLGPIDSGRSARGQIEEEVRAAARPPPGPCRLFIRRPLLCLPPSAARASRGPSLRAPRSFALVSPAAAASCAAPRCPAPGRCGATRLPCADPACPAHPSRPASSALPPLHLRLPSAQAALHAVLASLHADLLTLIGETCEQVDTSELPNGRIRLRWALLYRGDSVRASGRARERGVCARCSRSRDGRSSGSRGLRLLAGCGFCALARGLGAGQDNQPRLRWAEQEGRALRTHLRLMRAYTWRPPAPFSTCACAAAASSLAPQTRPRATQALFADAEAADAALSQAAHVISALNRLLREYARPPLLSCVYVFPPEYDVAGSNLHAKVAIARAEACAVLLCARLAVADGEAEADVRTRTLPLGAPEIVPPPLFEGGPPDAKAAVLDIVFVGPVRFEQLISERAAAEALEDAENERLQAIENEKAAAIEVALAAEREALAAEAEREKAKAVRAAIKAERARIEAENRTAANGGRTQNPQSKACSVQ